MVRLAPGEGWAPAQTRGTRLRHVGTIILDACMCWSHATSCPVSGHSL